MGAEYEVIKPVKRRLPSVEWTPSPPERTHILLLLAESGGKLTCFRSRNSRWAMRFWALRICVALALLGVSGDSDIVCVERVESEVGDD